MEPQISERWKHVADVAKSKQRGQDFWKRVLLHSGMGVAIAFFLYALSIPATRNAREPARRTQCRNNLKQIGLALHNYKDEHGSFPPAYTVDANGKPLHSWRTLILPYLDQAPLYKRIDFSKPWDDPVNAAVFESASIVVYQCPSITLPKNHTTYLAVTASGGVFHPSTTPRLFSKITDPHDETMMVIDGNVPRAVPWMAPQDIDEVHISSLTTALELNHPGAVQILFADGSVRCVLLEEFAENLRRWISIGGND